MKRIVSKGEYLKGVIFKTPNVIVQQVNANNRSKKCIIIGNGHSLSVDDRNRVIKHDPGMHKFLAPAYVEYTVHTFYFTFECGGLLQAGEDIARFANRLSSYDEIILVGHSKCGICLANAAKQILRKKVLITVSTPFDGTVIADKKAYEKILKYPLLIKVYNAIFSDHNVDKDIMPNSEAIKAIQGVKPDLNITSSIEKIRYCRSIVDLFLLFLDKYTGIKGDGVVPVLSQQACKPKRRVELTCSHATSLDEALKLLFDN